MHHGHQRIACSCVAASWSTLRNQDITTHTQPTHMDILLPPVWFRFLTKLNYSSHQKDVAMKLWDEIVEGHVYEHLRADETKMELYWSALKHCEQKLKKPMDWKLFQDIVPR